MCGKSPAPDGPAAALRARTAAGGTVGFDEFMQCALYDTDGGYYAGAELRTGRDGDYFTSVSTGPVFGRLLAAQFAEMCALLGDPEDFTIVEQGANDGRLMADVLAAPGGDAPRVFIVEPLPARRAAQERTLAPWRGRVSWVAHPADLPEFTGVLFANELLDAFPVKLLVRRGGTWFERRVGCTEGAFVFIEEPVRDPALRAAAEALPVPPDAPVFHTEIRPSLSPWMHGVAGRLARGWIFLIDYGHPADVRHAPARAGGSLAAYRGHRRMDDPLADPGRQDLTAHVDFTAAARAGLAAGLGLAGFTDQHHALAALAARVFPAMPAAALPPEAAREMRALRQLLHPESMGVSFKFLALSRAAPGGLASFAFARAPHAELDLSPAAASAE